MSDYLLDMSNSWSTAGWLKDQISTRTADDRYAVEVVGTRLTFADQRGLLSAYPGPAWPEDALIYKPPQVPNQQFYLVDINDAFQGCEYIRTTTNSLDKRIFARITPQRTAIFADSVDAFTQPWEGPTSWPGPGDPPPVLRDGFVIPGQNYRTERDVLADIIERLTGLPPTSPLIRPLIDEIINHPLRAGDLVNNPRAFVDRIRVLTPVNIPDERITRLVDTISTNREIIERVFVAPIERIER